MLIDSRPRLECVRKLQRRLRSLFDEVTSKGIGREILARSQIRVTRTRAESPSYRVKIECSRADFAIRSDEPYDHNRFYARDDVASLTEDRDAKSSEIELTK